MKLLLNYVPLFKITKQTMILAAVNLFILRAATPATIFFWPGRNSHAIRVLAVTHQHCLLQTHNFDKQYAKCVIPEWIEQEDGTTHTNKVIKTKLIMLYYASL